MRDKPPLALPHQEDGTRFLRDREAAALFDEQGLGKSRQLLDAVAQAKSSGEIEGALIVCPNTIKPTWGEEIERFTELPYAIFGSGRKARRLAFQSLRATFYVINYEAVSAELASLKALLRFKRMALVLDESHRIKTPEAKITKAIHALRTFAVRRYIMTGTPVANKPEDLWTQYFFLDDGEALGSSFDDFRQRFCVPSGGYTGIDNLRELLKPLSLRREKEGSVNLPQKSVVRIPIHLGGQQLGMYDELRRNLAIWIRDMSGDEMLAQAEDILTRLVRLAQLASNPGLIDSSYDEVPAKYRAIDELLPIYLSEPEDKVIIWTSFVANIAVLKSRLVSFNPVCIHGGLDSKAKQRSIRAFKTDPSVRVLLANPAAAREGLTLTQAKTAIYLDRTFNLVDYLQSQDRIHRLSQTKPCEIILLVAHATIDEFIDFSLEQKHRLARYTQGDTDEIEASDLALQKPELLRALIDPLVSQQRNEELDSGD
jgi:SWI/SNF-related matrix-associated actin-dependent regulator of chromatin subfamily A-like protein 1